MDAIDVILHSLRYAPLCLMGDGGSHITLDAGTGIQEIVKCSSVLFTPLMRAKPMYVSQLP